MAKKFINNQSFAKNSILQIVVGLREKISGTLIFINVNSILDRLANIQWLQCNYYWYTNIFQHSCPKQLFWTAE
jgi:hypothetical protein